MRFLKYLDALWRVIPATAAPPPQPPEPPRAEYQVRVDGQPVLDDEPVLTTARFIVGSTSVRIESAPGSSYRVVRESPGARTTTRLTDEAQVTEKFLQWVTEALSETAKDKLHIGTSARAQDVKLGSTTGACTAELGDMSAGSWERLEGRLHRQGQAGPKVFHYTPSRIGCSHCGQNNVVLRQVRDRRICETCWLDAKIPYADLAGLNMKNAINEAASLEANARWDEIASHSKQRTAAVATPEGEKDILRAGWERARRQMAFGAELSDLIQTDRERAAQAQVPKQLFCCVCKKTTLGPYDKQVRDKKVCLRCWYDPGLSFNSIATAAGCKSDVDLDEEVVRERHHALMAILAGGSRDKEPVLKNEGALKLILEQPAQPAQPQEGLTDYSHRTIWVLDYNWPEHSPKYMRPLRIIALAEGEEGPWS